MRLLSRSEEIILLAILKLGENAYGVQIRDQIFKDTGDTWSFGSIYMPLDKLTRKEFVSKIKGPPSPERGGKSKFYYKLTDEGIKALQEIQEAQKQMWSGIPDISKNIN